MRASLLLLLATIGITLGACGDDIQFADPPRKEDPHAGHNHGGLPAGHVPIEPGQASPGRIKTHSNEGDEGDPFADAEVTPSAQGDPNELLYSGTITLPEGVTLPDPAWVWVSAGFPPRGRPPVLTKLFTNPTWPLSFELRRGDVAFPGASVPAKADLVIYVSVGKNKFVEGIVLKFDPSEVKPMGTEGLALKLKKP